MPREGGAVAGANALASCLAYSCCSISMVRRAPRYPPAARSALTSLPAGLQVLANKAVLSKVSPPGRPRRRCARPGRR